MTLLDLSTPDSFVKINDIKNSNISSPRILSLGIKVSKILFQESIAISFNEGMEYSNYRFGIYRPSYIKYTVRSHFIETVPGSKLKKLNLQEQTSESRELNFSWESSHPVQTSNQLIFAQFSDALSFYRKIVFFATEHNETINYAILESSVAENCFESSTPDKNLSSFEIAKIISSTNVTCFNYSKKFKTVSGEDTCHVAPKDSISFEIENKSGHFGVKLYSSAWGTKTCYNIQALSDF